MSYQQRENRSGVSRLLVLKMAFGDDAIDYLKDDDYIEKFLEEAFLQEEVTKRDFLNNDLRVTSFLVKWTLFVQKYKNIYGSNMRDVDIISNLIQVKILTDDSLYKFRNKIFKTDFVLDESFLSELSYYLKALESVDLKMTLQINQKYKKLISSKVW